MSVNGTHNFEREKKTYTDKTKLNPAARDDSLRSKDMKRLVCTRNGTVFISLFTSDPPHGQTVLSLFTQHPVHDASSSSCFTADRGLTKMGGWVCGWALPPPISQMDH